jgi:hypothetical protein
VDCCQKVVSKYINNASIYSSPIYIYSNNNNLLHGWLILHGWTFFFIQGMKFGKMLVNSCSLLNHLLRGYLNLSLEFFFVEGMKCGKWSSKAIYNWKPWMTRGGWVFFGTVDFLEHTGHSISLWFFITSDLLRQAQKAWRALGRIYFYFIILFDFIEESLNERNYRCVSKKKTQPNELNAKPKIVIYPNKYLFSGLRLDCQIIYFIFQKPTLAI